MNDCLCKKMNPVKLEARDQTFDIARSICILWIVGLLHLTTYIDTRWIPSVVWSLLLKITYASLGTFVFISGYFLKNKKVESLLDCKRFYLSRFQRFWLPFFISALSLWVIGAVVGKPWFISPENFVLSVLGLSVFKGPLPSTLWFMVMMLFFYLITPLWLYKRTFRSSILKLVLLFAVLMILYKVGFLDNRLLVYAPIYIFSLSLPDSFTNYFRKNKGLVISFTLVLMGLLILNRSISSVSEYVVYYSAILVGYPLIISFSELLSSIVVVNKLSSFISYASMNMYLFHRQIYLFALFLFNISMFPNFHGATIPLWFAMLFVVPAIIAISYYIQKGYDKLLFIVVNRK